MFLSSYCGVSWCLPINYTSNLLISAKNPGSVGTTSNLPGTRLRFTESRLNSAWNRLRFMCWVRPCLRVRVLYGLTGVPPTVTPILDLGGWGVLLFNRVQCYMSLQGYCTYIRQTEKGVQGQVSTHISGWVAHSLVLPEGGYQPDTLVDTRQSAPFEVCLISIISFHKFLVGSMLFTMIIWPNSCVLIGWNAVSLPSVIQLWLSHSLYRCTY